MPTNASVTQRPPTETSVSPARDAILDLKARMAESIIVPEDPP